MKLTDFCILFAGLFVCLFLGRDLKIQILVASRLSEICYDRQMDRISEDALMDIVETENRDGTLVMRTEELEDKYKSLLSLALDLTDEDAALRAKEAVILYQLRQYPYNMTADELNDTLYAFRTHITEQRRTRREQQMLMINMPYIANDAWYQTLYGAQLLTVFDPREPIWGTDRVVFSGSRVLKLVK